MDSVNTKRAWPVSLYEIPGSGAHLAAFEGLRGLAVLLVFFVHFESLLRFILPSHSALSTWFRVLGDFGNMGVDLFFVMSGYLIYGGLIRRHRPFFEFMGRRVERIYPAFLTTVAIYLVLCVLYPTENKIPSSAFASAIYILENLLLLPGMFKIIPLVTVCWSLSFEFAFYLGLPLLVAVLSLRRRSFRSRIWVLAGIWLAFLLFLYLSSSGNHARMISFATGMLLFETRAAVNTQLTRKFPVQLVAGLSIGCIAVLRYSLERFPAFAVQCAIIALMSLGFAALCFFAAEPAGFIRKPFVWAPARYLGNMSYSYYLTHGLVLKGVARVLRHWVHAPLSSVGIFAVLLLSFSATWGFATLLFGLIEKPFSLQPAARYGRSKEAKEHPRDKATVFIPLVAEPQRQTQPLAEVLLETGHPE